jgi:murein DD-endopeptidase MepM/ murein hydrolase activator NlpD
VSLPPFLELRVPKPPTVAVAKDTSLLVHELHITNFADTARLTKIEVLDASAPQRVLFTAEDTALLPLVSRPGVPPRDTTRLRLPPGSRAIAFLWVPLAGGAQPDSISHRITIATGRRDSVRTRSLTGAVLPVSDPAAPIGPPLRGGAWLTGNGPARVSGHRRALIPVNGTPAIAQRFAIDFVMVDERGRRWEGDSLHNESYFAHGQDAIAVADGRVVAVKDSIPENVPGITSRAVPITLETVGGNYVVLDIGGGRHAFYAHLQPGSLRVKVGDQVRRGQVLGLVGNSGNSTEPHLHFHVADGIPPLGSEGLPYRMESFELLGSCTNFSSCTRQAPEVRRGEIPLGNWLVRFPD